MQPEIFWLLKCLTMNSSNSQTHNIQSTNHQQPQRHWQTSLYPCWCVLVDKTCCALITYPSSCIVELNWKSVAVLTLVFPTFQETTKGAPGKLSFHSEVHLERGNRRGFLGHIWSVSETWLNERRLHFCTLLRKKEKSSLQYVLFPDVHIKLN